MHMSLWAKCPVRITYPKRLKQTVSEVFQKIYASPLFNKDWDNPSNKRWADALEATQEAKTFLDSEGYGLYGSTAKEWDEMFHNFDNKFCKEVIMVKLLASTNVKNDEHSGWQKAIRLKSMGGRNVILVSTIRLHSLVKSGVMIRMPMLVCGIIVGLIRLKIIIMQTTWVEVP